MRIQPLLLVVSLAVTSCGGERAAGPIPIDSDDARRAMKALQGHISWGLVEELPGGFEVIQVRQIEGAEDRVLVVFDFKHPVPIPPQYADGHPGVCGESDGLFIRGAYGIVDYVTGSRGIIGYLSLPWDGCGAVAVTADASTATLLDGVTPAEAEAAVKEMTDDLWASDFLAQHPFTVVEVDRRDLEPAVIIPKVRFETPFPTEIFPGVVDDIPLPEGALVTGACYDTTTTDTPYENRGPYGFAPEWNNGEEWTQELGC